MKMTLVFNTVINSYLTLRFYFQKKNHKIHMFNNSLNFRGSALGLGFKQIVTLFLLDTTFPGHTNWFLEAAIIAFICHIHTY